MKVRTDFVSNSSSSSFILAGNKGTFAAKFKLNKQDFVDAIIGLSGGKAAYDEYVVAHKSKYWDGTWFNVYDKKVAKDKKRINSDATHYLKEWHSGIIRYDKIHQQVYKDYGYSLAKYARAYDTLRETFGLPWTYDFDVKTNYVESCDAKTHKWTKKSVPKHVDKVVRELHDYYGVMSNYDVLMCDFARFLFHFGDNDIYRLEGVEVPGKHENKFGTRTEYAIKHDKAIDNSIYESNSHSIQRVCEVLFNWFKSQGKLIGLKDETWKDLYNDVIAVTMHEG